MRTSPKMSPALSGLLSDVVYKEEAVEMSPEEASLLQEEINNISKQIESDTTDLGLVSKSLNRVLELTEDMNTAVDTDTTDSHTASLLLSEFASIYKDTLGQEFTYSKNLSSNSLEVKQVLTAGLQSANTFIETLKKIAKKIWESLKAAWKWFVSKISDFIKYIISKFSGSKAKQEDVVEVIIETSAMSNVAKSSIQEIDKTIDKLNKETESSLETLDEAIAMVEELQKDLDKEIVSMRQKAGLGKKRIELRKIRKILPDISKSPTKENVINFLEDIKSSQELEKHIIRAILSNEDLAGYVVRLKVYFEATRFTFKDRQGLVDLNTPKAVSTESKDIGIGLVSPKNTIRIENLKEDMLSMIFDGDFQKHIPYFIQSSFISPAIDMYKSAKALFKFASEDKFLNNDKYILNNFQNVGSAPVIREIDILSNLSSYRAVISIGSLYGIGYDSPNIEGELKVKDTSLPDDNKLLKLAHDAMSKKTDLEELFGDKIRAAQNIVPEKSISLLQESFKQAIEETDKFLDYFEKTPAETLEAKGKDLINNMFIIVQLLNKCNPTYISSSLGLVVDAHYGLFAKLFFVTDTAITDFNKKINN